MSSTPPPNESAWTPERRAWGRADLVAIGFWTAAIVFFFWDVVTLQRALFYFDITEINYPYRDFFARELRAGRFTRWCPELFCGMPLYSESQAGYLHPLKYLLYPWLPTWQAFNLDTVGSVWLTGLGAYGWLRRHVGAIGALTGAAIFGLSGFVWAHLIHTSMNNALTSVPLIVWSLEAAWERARWRPLVGGAVALACQVFAGHLQDTLLTGALVGVYGLYRAATETGLRARVLAMLMPVALVGLGVALAAVQWIPSKELLDRSPRAGGLSWSDLTYGSWHPELLPTLVVREAYGTRARDTDWMDGFYPYHEMNAYLGIIAIGLAVVGAAAYRDRWAAFWLIIAVLGSVLMLGRFTILFDVAHRIPVIGSSRIPVRFHLWVSLAVAALGAIGADRLARPGSVNLRGAIATIAWLTLLSIPILLYLYWPVWSAPNRWTKPYHVSRYAWLGRELSVAAVRTAGLGVAAWFVASTAARTSDARRRRWLAALLPVLVTADLLGAHVADVPTVPPAYWTVPPESAVKLKADPGLLRICGESKFSAGEPGYASEPVDFFPVRDGLGWSLPPVWGLSSCIGATPMVPRRLIEFSDTFRDTGPGSAELRFALEATSHFVTSNVPPPNAARSETAGKAFIYRVRDALPRARLVGQPVYADSERAALDALRALGASLRDRVVVEDPDRPLRADAQVAGQAAITTDMPEHVEVETESETPAYLVLADTFDPGWSATVDGRPAPIREAYVAFRGVYLTPGRHRIVFTYRPAGFVTGLAITGVGIVVAIVLLVWPWSPGRLNPEHGVMGWPRAWPLWLFAACAAIVLVSVVHVGSDGVRFQSRWRDGFHQFTWGAGLEAMHRLAKLR